MRPLWLCTDTSIRGNVCVQGLFCAFVPGDAANLTQQLMIYTGLAQQPARVDRSANVSRLIGQPRSATQPTHVGQAI
ncbi:hypothetical protein [Bacteroides reticulotermitis]|uniref:hypothetical protein n=1 Tax=Bacteroides reticulotermitis TaxID=1133319 RepID=UPI003A8B12D0